MRLVRLLLARLRGRRTHPAWVDVIKNKAGL